MSLRNAVTFSGKLVRRFCRQPVDPHREDLARRVIQARDLAVGQCRRQLHWRQPGGVEDLVGIRVADSAEDVGVGQRSLQRVILLSQSRGEGWLVGGQHLEALRIVRRERRFTADDMNRGLTFGSSFGQQQGPVREIEGSQPDLSGNRRAGLAPSEPAGDHQMDDDEEVLVEGKDNPLAQAAKTPDVAAGEVARARLDCADDERIAQADPLQPLSHQPCRQGVYVYRYVRQLRHVRKPRQRLYMNLPPFLFRLTEYGGVHVPGSALALVQWRGDSRFRGPAGGPDGPDSTAGRPLSGCHGRCGGSGNPSQFLLAPASHVARSAERRGVDEAAAGPFSPAERHRVARG